MRLLRSGKIRSSNSVSTEKNAEEPETGTDKSAFTRAGQEST